MTKSRLFAIVVIIVVTVITSVIILHNNAIYALAVVSPNGKYTIKVEKEIGDMEFGDWLVIKMFSTDRDPVEIDRVYEQVLLTIYDDVVLNIKWIDNTHVKVNERTINVAEYIKD